MLTFSDCFCCIEMEDKVRSSSDTLWRDDCKRAARSSASPEQVRAETVESRPQRDFGGWLNSTFYFVNKLLNTSERAAHHWELCKLVDLVLLLAIQVIHQQPGAVKLSVSTFLNFRGRWSFLCRTIGSMFIFSTRVSCWNLGENESLR